MYKIVINKGKEKQLVKHHPWVFTGAINSVTPTFTTPNWAEVVKEDGSFISYGWYDKDSHIVLHLLSWDKNEIVGEEFISSLIKESIYRRKPFFSLKGTNSFRLIHGEADFLPGLVADVYSKEIRVIISSRFALFHLDLIISTLNSLLKPNLIQVNTDPQYAKSEHLGEEVSYYVDGKKVKEIEDKNVLFIESGIYYESPHGKGQKSGFYLDQRDNRNIIEEYAKGKNVLDICSFTGGFTLHSLRAGALRVDAVDSSESALRHLLFQVNLNVTKGTIPPDSRERITIKSEDAFNYLRTIENDFYDFIILDPPKLSKTKGELEKAEKAYKDINRVAMSKIKDGGIIASFSCSSAMTRENFKRIIAWAASDNNYEIQILRVLSAGEDHPVRISFDESEYLKGFIYKVIKKN